MAKYGCPRKLISVVRQLHKGIQARVQDIGELSQPFPISNGVKQGYVLAVKLYSMMFSALMLLEKGILEIDIKYCNNEKLFKLRRLQAKKSRSNLTSSEVSYLLMTVLLRLALRLICKIVWTDSPKHAPILGLPSIQRKQKLCTNQLLAKLIQSQSSRQMVWSWTLSIDSHTWVAHCPRMSTLMMEWSPGFRTLAALLADYIQMFGIKEALVFT